MHNNIMAASSRDCPPMLAMGSYAHPYKISHIIIPGQPATDESPEVLEQTTVDVTPSNL
ncbi:hypothetical protein Tco_0593288, partial [Tanacetum coccineum]